MATNKTLGANPSTLVAGSPRAGSASTLPPSERIGVVFVHGIGSQKPGETLLQWSAPLIDAVTGWLAWPEPNAAGRVLPGRLPNDPRDPVLTAEFDLMSPLPKITLRIPRTTLPGSPDPHPTTEWVLTEAWWASRVTPPSLSTMTAWLGPGGAAGRIVEPILRSHENQGLVYQVARAALTPFITVLSALILSLYALTRAILAVIPFQTVKDAAVLKAFDEFIVGWFGDVRILLYDPAQSANIRSGLAEAVRALRKTCGHVVVMAHSGGAMVSYLTLTDPSLADVQVDKLITFGEGWNLALTLTKGPDGTIDGMGDRLRRNLVDAQPAIRWRDFYASDDPAPAGPLRVGDATPDMTMTDRIRSCEVWNRRSLLGDHGGYFDNDEEFTLQVLKEIDVPAGWGESSRFYRPDADAPPVEPCTPPASTVVSEPRAQRHRQRVALLALWRHTVVLLGVSAVALAIRFAPTQLIDIGRWVSAWLPDDVPIVTDLLEAIAKFAGTGIEEIQRSFLGTTLPAGSVVGLVEGIGVGVLQAVVPMSAAYLWAARPDAYRAWPATSRAGLMVRIAELVGFVLLAASLIAIVFPAFSLSVGQTVLLPRAEGGLLLGAGFPDWWPGIIVTIAVIVLAAGGTIIATAWRRSAAVTNTYAAIAAGLFLIALACSVIAVFRKPGVLDSEFAYAAIWVGAYVLLAIGRSRWATWDRVERRIASGPVADVPVERRPVIATSLGLVLASLTMISLVLDRSTGITGVLALGTGALLLLGIALGAKAWTGAGNSVHAPGPVDPGGA